MTSSSVRRPITKGSPRPRTLGDETLLESVFASVGVGLCLLDPQGLVRRANPRWLDSMSLGAEDALGRYAWELSPGTPPGIRELFARARAGEVVDLPEHRYTRSGEEHWYAGRLTPVPFPDGLGVLISTWDVTEAKRLERELRRHAELLHIAHDAIFTWSFRGGIESWNVGAQELYGYRAEEARGVQSRTLLRSVFPMPWAEVEAVLRDRGVFSGEVRHTRKDGRVLTVAARLQLVRTEEGGELVLEATHDVTEQKEARERAEWIARFPGENPEPVMRLTGDGSVLYANDAAARYFGAATGARAPTPIEAAARRSVEAGESIQAEFSFGGSVYSANLVPAGDEVNLYAQNVTARKKAEDALREANERLREIDRRKDDFLAMLSHELRNPLAPISNAVAILEQASPGGVHAARAQAVIRRQVDHLAHLVGDLLDVARIARGKIAIRPEPLEIGPLVKRSAEDHRALMYERGLSLAIDPGASDVWVQGDATRLTQVFGNLLQNAAKFTEWGGRVSVSVRSGEGFVEVCVSDTGAGMEPPLLARVFDPFVQADQSLARSQGGLGLGLALVRGIVEMHQGTVRAESQGRGKGSSFVVRLPTLADGVSPVVNAHPAEPVRPRRVLVVDDNADGAVSLSEMLGLYGHEVDVAFDGPSAIEKVRTRRPEVVLCDLGLPGMTGYEVARQLRARWPTGLKLIALSGYAQPDDVQACREAGFDAHVAKPPDPGELAALVGA